MILTPSDDSKRADLAKYSKEPTEMEAPPPEASRFEVNFLTLPFFALWDKDVKKRTKTEYKMVTRRGDEKLEIAWMVASNPEFGYPGPFDKTVHKAIEQIISELPLPIQNPIPLGSLYGLCKRMGISKYGGSQYGKIREALVRIITTTIISKGAFYSKGKERWIEDVFHLYEHIALKGEKLSNGEIADTNYLYLNSWYLDNINAHYVKPVDWEYYKSLETPIAQRLYELLGVKFYGLLMKRKAFITYRYSTLCALLPIARQKYLSDARKLLDPAHERLKETGFLDGWSWEDLPQRRREKDWLVTYYPGKKARAEIEQFKAEGQLEFELPPPGEERIKDEAELSIEESGITFQLMQRGITGVTARKLVRACPTEQIQRQIEVFDWLKERGDQLVKKNPAGFLRKSVEDNYEAPAGYLREQKRVREIIEKEAEQTRADEIQRRVDEYWEQLEGQDRHLLRQEAIELIEGNKAIKKEFVTEALIRSIESEIVKKRLHLES